MARKSSHNSSAPGPKKKISAQTRVKLSQAAKRRRRGLKGTPLGGKFAAGAGHAVTGGKGPRPGVREQRVRVEQSLAQEHAGSDPKLIKRAAVMQVRLSRNPQAAKDQLYASELQDAPVTVSRKAVREVELQNRRDHWEKAGVFKTDSPKSLARWMKEDAPPELRDKLDAMAKDTQSPFVRGLSGENPGKGRYSPGTRRRLEMYASDRQKGMSHTEALAHVEFAKQGPQGPKPKKVFPTGLDTRDQPATGRRTKGYDPAATRNEMFKFGLSARAAEKVSELGKRYDDLSENELIQMREAQKYSLFDNLAEQAWAHETRRANLLGAQTGDLKAKPDRVAVFTTNIKGLPVVSFPSDSLMGQFVIHRRKRFMRAAKVPARELRGEFPAAVRDRHVMELATTGNYGIAGEHGFFRRTGWRRGNKVHGLDKPKAFGSQIMYDSTGAPIYDEKGNIRYTQGATRRFGYESPNVGFRVFIG